MSTDSPGVNSSRAPAPASASPRSARCSPQDGFAGDAKPEAPRPAAFRAQGQARRLPAPVGRPLADGPVRLQADSSNKLARHRTARQRAHGPAHHRHDLGPEAASRWRTRSSSSSSTASPAHGSASCCRITAKIVDDITIIKTMNTDAINHDPAITFIQSGSQQPGRPSMGAWVSYGLGSENQNLPAFVVMLSQAQALNADQPLFSRLWGSGFLPSNHQGVRFRAGSDPVLYLHDPRRHRPRDPPRHARRAGRAQSRCISTSSAIRRSKRASRSTRWRSGCRPRCPT